MRPTKDERITRVMNSLNDGFDVDGDDVSFQSVERLSEDACMDLFNLLLGTFSQVACSTRFRIGDMYNLMGKSDRTLRRNVMQRIAATYSENQRQHLRSCGWVAAKWPREKRSGHSWSYFVQNHPSKPPAEKKDKDLPVYTMISVEERKTGLAVTGHDFGGKKVIMIMPKRLLQKDYPGAHVFHHDMATAEDHEEYDAFSDRELEPA